MISPPFPAFSSSEEDCRNSSRVEQLSTLWGQEEETEINGAPVPTHNQKWSDEGATLCGEAMKDFEQSRAAVDNKDMTRAVALYEAIIVKVERAIGLWRASQFVTPLDDRLRACREWATGFLLQVKLSLGVAASQMGNVEEALCQFVSIMGSDCKIDSQFAGTKPDACMCLGQIFKQLGFGDERTGAAGRCFSSAAHLDCHASKRQQQFLQRQATLETQQQHPASTRTEAYNGLLTLRSSPCRPKTLESFKEKDWNTCDEMAAQLLSNFAQSPAKGPPPNSEVRRASPFDKIFKASPAVPKAPFSVYRDHEEQTGSPLPPRLPRTPSDGQQQSRWFCCEPSCGEVFTTRDALRAHVRTTGHPASENGKRPLSHISHGNQQEAEATSSKRQVVQEAFEEVFASSASEES